jgi:hypothetical protein
VRLPEKTKTLLAFSNLTNVTAIALISIFALGTT